MQKAKILFYNETTGSGIAITKSKEKIKFSIEQWDEYDILPATGLEIKFKIENNIPINIKVNKKPETSEKASQKDDDTSDFETTNTTIQDTENKNTDLTKAEKELNSFLNSSSNNLDSLERKISLSKDISETIHNYFEYIKAEVTKREGYNKVSGRLSYSLARRFIWTMFNNLIDIDQNIITLRIKSISDDLKFTSQIKDDFDKKVKYPLVAFDEIFLSAQVEYMLVKTMTKQTKDKLNLLKTKEKTVGKQKEKKKKEIQATRNKELLKELQRKLKVINGTYADIVHMMAQLQEILEKNTKRLKVFEDNYRQTFFKTFHTEADKYQASITNILDAQAYLLDSLLWKEAKNSTETMNYFKSFSIDVELNTKTYLKYYLSTIDEGKANEENQELYKLYDYLCEQQKDYILIITSSAESSLEYSQSIVSTRKTLEVKSFISELESIKWAMKNTIKVIVLENNLLSTSAQKYLDYYHNNIFSKPKIILIGATQPIKSSNYTITKTLASGITPRVLTNTLIKMIDE